MKPLPGAVFNPQPKHTVFFGRKNQTRTRGPSQTHPSFVLSRRPIWGGARFFSHGHETYLFRFSVSRAHGISGNRILSVSVRDRWLLGPPAEPPARRPVFPIRDLGGGTSAGIADCRVRVTTRAAALTARVSTVHHSTAAAALI